MASGMAANDECKLKVLELKTKRNYIYITYKIENQQVIDKISSPDETYEDFANSLPTLPQFTWAEVCDIHFQ